jgi:hypothetical protein
MLAGLGAMGFVARRRKPPPDRPIFLSAASE